MYRKYGTDIPVTSAKANAQPVLAVQAVYTAVALHPIILGTSEVPTLIS